MEERLSKVEQSLARIEVQQANLDRTCSSILEQLRILKVDVHRSLHGNSHTPGLMVRTDRLEQWKTRTTGIIGIVIGAIVPLLAARAWEVLQ